MIDVNMDEALLDSEQAMVRVPEPDASEPDIAPRADHDRQLEVVGDRSGAECLQGKGVVNSDQPQGGRGEVQAAGAADSAIRRRRVVVMAFDERGQADTFERRIEVCERSYRILTTEVGFPAQDIIFDPNVLTVGTGIEEHANYAVDFIRATHWIKRNLPLARVSGGISNVSFAFRGNNVVREAMHAAFLYHAVQAGAGHMGSFNAGMPTGL
jgi:5-methyltetrahydrofolate--homocysteine methyltransferase